MYASSNKSGSLVDPREVVYTKSVSNAHTSEYIYYECQKVNLTGRVVNCEYEETRVAPILAKPSDYKFCIQRIEASLIDIPLFNADEKVLAVTCSYPPDNLAAVQVVVLPAGVDIYNINQVIPEINTALFNSFLALQGLYDAIYGAGAWALNPLLSKEPFGVKYDAITDRLVIYSDVRNAGFLPNAMFLSFNAQLQELFKGNTYYLSPPNQVLFTPGFGDNAEVILPDTVTYLQNVAAYSTTAMWYSIKQIVVISNRLGARLVQIGTPGQGGQAATRSIVLDFNYVPDNANNSPGTRLNFLSNNNRWTDMSADTPLHSIDFSLYYRNKNEVLVPIKLRPLESFSLLCLFAKTLTN